MTKFQKNIIEARLAAANGKRRERILSIDYVLKSIKACMRTSKKEGCALYYASGGSVCNSYGYPSYKTACLIVGIGTEIYFSIRKVSASSGSTGFGRIDNLKITPENLMEKIKAYGLDLL